MATPKIPAQNQIRIRAKMTFIVSELNPSERTSSEGRQTTVRFDITDELSKAVWAVLVAQFKAGNLIPVLN